MSFDRIDEYIGKLTAASEIKVVRSERDRLASELQTQQSNAASLEDKLQVLSRRLEDQSQQLEAKNKVIEELQSKLSERDGEVDRLSGITSVVAGEELTVPKLEEKIAQVKHREIKAEADRRFDQYKADWQEKSKPTEVRDEALRALSTTISVLGGPEPHYLAKDMVDLGLPSSVLKIISTDVDRRMNQEFQRRVERESDRKASEKLATRTNVEWPKWYAANVAPRVEELRIAFNSNAINQISGPWIFTCDKCQTIFETHLGKDQIESLLRQEYCEVPCPNQQCVDQIVFSRRTHVLKVRLEALINFYLQQ